MSSSFSATSSETTWKYTLKKLTDVRRAAGLALLVAYLLHLIQNRHVQIPT